MGRTGRKRKGRVVLLLSQGREEEAYNRAQSQYKTVQNAIATQQGNKITMFCPSSDVIPQNQPKPECQKMIMNIAEMATNCILKRKASSNSEQFSTPDIYLNAAEKQEYQSFFQVSNDVPSEIILGRYTYRNLMPLPVVNFARCNRSLDFTALIANLEDLVSKEEELLLVNCFIIFKSKKRSSREYKYNIRAIGRIEEASSSPISMDIGETLKFRSKELLLQSDLTQSPLPLNYQLCDAENLDNALGISSDDDTIYLKPICDLQSPLINCCSDQEISNQISTEISAKPEMITPEHRLEHLDKKQNDNLSEVNGEIPSLYSQTPIIKARKKKMIISDASSSAKSDVFVKPAPINGKRSLRPNNLSKSKKKRLDYSNLYFDLEAVLSEGSMLSNDEDDSIIDLDRNLSGLIAESPTLNSQEINFYRKSLLSPELGGLGCRKQTFRFATPNKFEPCTQLIPDSDTPGSLVNFVVDDASLFSGDSAHYDHEISDQDDSVRLEDFLATSSSDQEL